MLETMLASFVVILCAGALLGLGQWFGRPPIRGKCSPDSEDCCLRRRCAEVCPHRGGQ